MITRYNIGVKKFIKKVFTKKVLIILGSVLLCLGLVFLNAFHSNNNQLKVREETITSAKFNKSFNGITIGYFSDLHYGNFIDDGFLDMFKERMNSYNPDVIIFGGDLVDHYSTLSLDDEERVHLVECLSSFNPKFGKYAVLGNHDLDSEEVKATISSLLEESGFKIITNTSTRIYINKNNYFNIVGIDSMSLGEPNIEEAFANVDSTRFTFTVTHCPDIFDDIPKTKTDYVLSGHSHGGQIYIPIVSMFERSYGCEKYYRGKTKDGNTILDISNGVGRTKTNARLNADAEIVIYKLKAMN